MRRSAFKRQPHGEVELDLCFTCQGIWFDEYESAQMAPPAFSNSFALTHEHRDDTRQPWRDTLNCPRCNERLIQGLDRTKNGNFAYHRCPQRHGRFNSFSAFMCEKGFVRQLNGAEIAELAAKVQVIRCSGCGAPVDIRRDNTCSHCRSPIVILNPAAVDKALADFGTRLTGRNTSTARLRRCADRQRAAEIASGTREEEIGARHRHHRSCSRRRRSTLATPPSLKRRESGHPVRHPQTAAAHGAKMADKFQERTMSEENAFFRPVKDSARSSIVSCAPDDALIGVVGIMREKNISSVIVIDQARRSASSPTATCATRSSPPASAPTSSRCAMS